MKFHLHLCWFHTSDETLCVLNFCIQCKSIQNTMKVFYILDIWNGYPQLEIFCNLHNSLRVQYSVTLWCDVIKPERLYNMKIVCFVVARGQWIDIHLIQSFQDSKQRKNPIRLKSSYDTVLCFFLSVILTSWIAH